VLIVLFLLLVLIFAGAGFALHILWVLAVIFFVFWLIGVALGRGASAGNHKFYSGSRSHLPSGRFPASWSIPWASSSRKLSVTASSVTISEAKGYL
jgi:hypothetical protein